MTEDGKTNPDDWRRKEEEAIRKIYDLPRPYLMIISGNEDDCDASKDELLFGNVADAAQKLMEKYPGTVKENTKKKNKIEHDGMSTVDTIHVTLAKLFGCDKIASFDRDFKEVESEIPSLMIKEIYKI